ncbi:glycosyltransferase [Neisseria perflava]|uniref:glycosyltransferase n=1 Tax=Neisseria perflava TaxID=33053 RepID=UPI00209FF53E|nr:glycosyltransferase [Neisseria perflava]MCP1659281.1 GT2 family glycosyltransferase [Neisseria perflava]MCP1772789.1 GT2 family glycosyltransferase [Neisseria perflava]
MYEFEFVVATTKNAEQFWQETAFGISWRHHQAGKDWKNNTSIYVRFENRQGLPEVYNRRINDPNSGEYLVFVHDDVWLNDYFTPQRLREAFQQFDVVGVVGNRYCTPTQPSWCHTGFDERGKLVRDVRSHFSGAIAQGEDALGVLQSWGVSPQPVAVLDGVFIAVNKRRLLESDVQFDTRFDFHFYDMDFCRSAIAAGLNIGTWPIVMTHQSGGAFKRQWRKAYQVYLEKWNPPRKSSLKVVSHRRRSAKIE